MFLILVHLWRWKRTTNLLWDLVLLMIQSKRTLILLPQMMIWKMKKNIWINHSLWTLDLDGSIVHLTPWKSHISSEFWDTNQVKKTRNLVALSTFISTFKPKNVKEFLMDVDWVISMQDELHQFEQSNVWYLSQDLLTEPLLGQGGCSEKRWMIMEAIRILISFQTFIGFKLFQMEFKSYFWMVIWRKQYMLNIHLELSMQICQIMCSNSTKICTGWSRHLELGIKGCQGF